MVADIMVAPSMAATLPNYTLDASLNKYAFIRFSAVASLDSALAEEVSLIRISSQPLK